MQKEREILLLSIFTFLTILLWIVFELTKTYKTTTITSNTTNLIKPFNPKIDVSLIESISKRVSYE
jgi:hypothetical protein